MHEDKDIKITTHDRLLRAWETSMELTRDFEMYSKRIEDTEEIRQIFKEFAEVEGAHASRLRSLLLEYQDEN